VKRKGTFYRGRPLKGDAHSDRAQWQVRFRVVDEALRRYLGLGLLDHVGKRSRLGEADALALANEEGQR
jgi:hypothetical protein